MADINSLWSQAKLKNSQLFKIVRPILLTLCATQCCFALCFLALGVAGIFLASAFAYIGMPIWAGCFGCVLSAFWAGISSRPTQHSHGIVLMLLVQTAHTALFVFSFITASIDFSNLFTSLNAITSSPINCASLQIVNPNVLMGRLLVDILVIVISLIPMIADTAIVYYGCRIYGKHGFMCNKPRSETLSKGAISLSNIQSQVNSNKIEDSNDAAQVEEARKKNMSKVIKKMVLRLLWPFLSIMMTLTLAAIAVAIVGLVLGVQVGLPPPVWNILAIILNFIGLRKLKKGKKNWHVFLFVSFAISATGNIAVIVLGAINLHKDWTYVSFLYQVTNALAACTSNSTTVATSTFFSTSASTSAVSGSSLSVTASASASAIVSTTLASPSSNLAKTWLLVLETLHIMLNFYLAVLAATHIMTLVKIVKFMKKRAAAKAKRQQVEQSHNQNDNPMYKTDL